MPDAPLLKRVPFRPQRKKRPLFFLYHKSRVTSVIFVKNEYKSIRRAVPGIEEKNRGEEFLLQQLNDLIWINNIAFIRKRRMNTHGKEKAMIWNQPGD